ncbi:hypothetical protein WM16_20795 [Burkholderia ubonensis]|uniref:Uncharacterized protein n=1 Tax=Burkholderia ubonensis TaxID=101571 RepID=A0A108CB55_9BURK|nr:hypothetical protein WJ35_08885 [Burkholderia ubonensis]KWE75455.1 hypothetical protein WL79_12035 [Burkholderia ubonensis]KWE77138.1 hypothetical protein WL77_03665 [Burkholderia ubonensis]KWI68135.1 hypothetical protein WM07_15390 [Burkholderia ubonensis]KWK71149.1 hypothetical protein WM16_20795 [Burkholderia ubonensis]
MSLAIGASRWAALRVGEAVDDDMIMELGDAADYKSNPPRPGLSRAPRARFWPSGRGAGAAIVDRL